MPPKSIPLKSWFQEQYPSHKCNECDVPHHAYPTFKLTVEEDGERVRHLYIPTELALVVDGPTRPGQGQPIDTPARALILFWAAPLWDTSNTHQSPIYMN